MAYNVPKILSAEIKYRVRLLTIGKRSFPSLEQIKMSLGQAIKKARRFMVAGMSNGEIVARLAAQFNYHLDGRTVQGERKRLAYQLLKN